MSELYRSNSPRLLVAAGWLIGAFLLLPIVIVFPIAFTDQSYLSLPRAGLSLDHFRRLLHDSDWLHSAGQSGLIALTSAALAVVSGAACAIGCWRAQSRWVRPVQVSMILPLVVPPLVYALGYYRLLMHVSLLDTVLGVVLAHAITAVPYVFLTVTANLAGFDRSLELAARGMGASTSQTLLRVILPNIGPGLMSGAILAFVHSWDEIVVVLFIASRNVYTLPRRIWDGITTDLDPMMAAAAALLIVSSLVLLAMNLLIGSKRATSSH